jgi:hypothetical protein
MKIKMYASIEGLELVVAIYLIDVKLDGSCSE